MAKSNSCPWLVRRKIRHQKIGLASPPALSKREGAKVQEVQKVQDLKVNGKQ
jgi:hypothetical protein